MSYVVKESSISYLVEEGRSFDLPEEVIPILKSAGFRNVIATLEKDTHVITAHGLPRIGQKSVHVKMQQQ